MRLRESFRVSVSDGSSSKLPRTSSHPSLCTNQSFSCEKENKWLNEADYAIDVSTIPRGGSRRRKSMEPKLLASSTFTPAKQPTMSPTKEFLNLGTPTPRRETVHLPATADRQTTLDLLPPNDSPTQVTPVKQQMAQPTDYDTPSADFDDGKSSFGSPATPYFLHPQQLVQQTCPPKQSQEVFFPVSGKIEDQPNENLRKRLLMARRKSLQWAPRLSSPLARAHSYQ